MHQKMVEALTWALELQPEPAVLKWPVAVLGAAFFGLLLFAIFQYQTSERRWGMKLVLGLLGGATIAGLGTSAFHWVTGALYGIGYLLTWLAWVLTRRWSWWRRALARGLTAGITLGPWLWLGATEKASIKGNESVLAAWLLAPSGLIWFWMLLGALWLLVVIGGWDCWGWSGLRPQRRRWLVATWAVLGVLGLNWYAAGRVDLFAVCEKGQHWRLGYVLMSRPGSQWYRDSRGATPLHLAGSPAAIRLLLAVGAEANVKMEYGETPLHRASSGRHAESLRLLLAAGADANARMEYGGTPLHQAACAGDAEAIRLLLAAGADINATVFLDETPLYRAASGGHAEALRLLLAAGADVKAKKKDGSTPLHKAAAKGRAEAIRLLLAAGADANARDNRGQTSLHWAAAGAEAEAIRMLVAAGAEVNAKTQETSEMYLSGAGNAHLAACTTPLHVAAVFGRVEAIPALLAGGAIVNEPNEKGLTAMDDAANDECRKLLRAAGGKTGKELDAEKQVPPK